MVLVPGEQAAAHPGLWLRTSGKTQIAAHLAEALWRSHGVELMAWVNASSRAAVLAGYVEAAARLGLDQGGDAEPVAARFLAWLGWTARPWLLVLDDLQQIGDLSGLLPGGPAGQVLVTAADEGAVAGWRSTVTIPVPPFSQRESMDYLFERLTTDPDQRSGAYELAEELGGEAAALAQASALIVDSDAGCRDYQRHFTRRRDRLRGSAEDELPAAAVTWTLSAEYAEELAPDAGTWPLLVLAALLDGHGIPLEVLTSQAACQYLAEAVPGLPPGPQHPQSALRALERAGLASAGPVVRVSTPLQAAVRAAASRELLERAARAAADAVLETWPDDQPRSALAAQMRACAESLLGHAGDSLWHGGNCHRVLLAAGRSLAAARISGPAVAWWQDIAIRCDRLLGKDAPDTLTAAEQLADALLAAGQSADAVRCTRRVLEGRERMLGADHPAAIAARISLGQALAADGDASNALKVLRDAATRSGHAHGRGDPEALDILDELAAAFLAAGDAAAAVRLRRQALASRRQRHGPADPATLAAAIRLADACLADGKERAAISHYKDVLAAREETLGPEHPSTLAAHASLAAAYDAVGQVGDALREHQRACAGYVRVFGPDHSLTLMCRADLASAYHAAGQVSDAISILHDDVRRAEQALSPDDPVTRRLRQVRDSITAGMVAG